ERVNVDETVRLVPVDRNLPLPMFQPSLSIPTVPVKLCTESAGSYPSARSAVIGKFRRPSCHRKHNVDVSLVIWRGRFIHEGPQGSLNKRAPSSGWTSRISIGRRGVARGRT